MTVQTPARPARSSGWGGWVPFALVGLVLIPAIAGSLRLVEVFGGAHLFGRRTISRRTIRRRTISATAKVGSS